MNMRDYSRVQASLRTIAQTAPDHAARTLQRAGIRIMKRAQEYVPEDTAALRESIGIVKGKDGRRVTIDVMTDASVVLADGRSMPVETYALIVHETYDQWIKNPSEKTKEKMSRHPGKVGSFFLTNAMKDEEATFIEGVYQAVTEAIEAEDL